jgi:hypothetical protein
MGQARFVGQDFPVRIEKRFGPSASPGFHVLLEDLLRFQTSGDHNEGPLWEQSRKQSRHERLCAGADRFGKQSPLLHAPAQGLRGGSRLHDRKNLTGRVF